MTAGCNRCGAPLVPEEGTGGGDATVGTVRGLLEGPAAWSCPAGHGRRTADLAAAHGEVRDALDVARRTRLRNELRCGVCDTPFALPGRRATRSVTLTTTGLPATTVTLDVPLLRCTTDAVDNLPPECLDDLDTVLDQLLGGSS